LATGEETAALDEKQNIRLKEEGSTVLPTKKKKKGGKKPEQKNRSGEIRFGKEDHGGGSRRRKKGGKNWKITRNQNTHTTSRNRPGVV